ncbi:MAG: YbjN domain-containing protein [Gemmatimonadota bacterium]
MVTREDLESFLIRMGADFEELEEGMYLARTRNDDYPIVLHYSPPLLLLRLKVMDLPEEKGSMELFRTLLELNANDVVHGAYGLEDGELILSDTLELANLDFEEIQASIESIHLAASGHMGRIRDMAGETSGG